ncbi:nuclear transport factor 2 family protein [Variovorax sp. HJSM1_2]|uniref:nuclear transport factor 2 family protein n=1 Tax=Variovorax sp. HJSM1_2 TaxID=3366263 RepID=UPI003BC9B0D5
MSLLDDRSREQRDGATIPPEIQALIDRAAIQDVLMLYFSAADAGDRLAVRQCFTEDVRAQYESRPEVRGVDALLEQIVLLGNLASGVCRVSTHFAGNLRFKELRREWAETELNAFACLVDQSGTTVAIRSLRYLDRLRKEDGEWKVAARLHTLDWAMAVPCTFARPFAEKLTSWHGLQMG